VCHHCWQPFCNFIFSLQASYTRVLNPQYSSQFFKQNDTIIFGFRTPASHFHFHDCKRENLEMELVLMALKSSRDCYESFCSCGHFTFNSIMVIHLSKHRTFYSLCVFVDMVSIHKFMMQRFVVSLIKSLVQWFHRTH
jgi:hypothetical protein